MSILKLTAAVFAAGLFLIGCNSDQTQRTANVDPYPNDAAVTESAGDEYWAKDNLDLERVGNLLERSESPEQFESYLNEEDGINNLDLNGDGYVDYISVEEFGDNDSNSRGLSLFSRFGPEMIQEIATILLHRDGPNYPGARFVINGNEQLYGDSNYYEANWLDRAIPLVSTLFGDHERYRSPYYYDNYPSGYDVYEIVETPAYRTRIVERYPQPVFVYTDAPTFISKVKIQSPHKGKWMDKIHAKLAKPNQRQEEFIKSNPGRPHPGKDDKGGRRNDSLRAEDKPGKGDDNPKADRGDDRGNPAKHDRGDDRGKPNKPDGGKADNPGKGKDNDGGGGKKP